jgi:hypothetical protein
MRARESIIIVDRHMVHRHSHYIIPLGLKTVREFQGKQAIPMASSGSRILVRNIEKGKRVNHVYLLKPCTKDSRRAYSIVNTAIFSFDAKKLKSARIVNMLTRLRI